LGYDDLRRGHPAELLVLRTLAVPSPEVSPALREVLGASDDADLGFENRRSRATDPAGGGAINRTVSLLDLVRGEEASSVDVVDVPGGRSFHGAELAAARSPGVSVDGGVVLELSPDLVGSLERPHRRTMLIARTLVEDGHVMHVADGREFAAGAVRQAGAHRVPTAYRLDDLTIGIIWAITNTDSAILADDSSLVLLSAVTDSIRGELGLVCDAQRSTKAEQRLEAVARIRLLRTSYHPTSPRTHDRTVLLEPRTTR
jgi:hypothetical protein